MFQNLVRRDMNHAPSGEQDDFDRAYESLRKGPRDLESLLPKLRAALAPVLGTRAQSLTPPLRNGINRLIGRKTPALASD